MVTRPVTTVYEVKVQLQGRPTIAGNLFKEKAYYFKTKEEAESFKKHRIEREKDRGATVTEKLALEENGSCIVIRELGESDRDAFVWKFISHVRIHSRGESFAGYHNRIFSITDDMMRSTSYSNFSDNIFPEIFNETAISNVNIDPNVRTLLVRGVSICQVVPEAVKSFTDASELIVRDKIETQLDKISKIKNSIKDASSKIERKKLELKQAKEEIAELMKSELGVKFVKEYASSLAQLNIEDPQSSQVLNESSSEDSDEWSRDSDDVNEEAPKPRM
jgi:hypothetical protein